MPFQDEMIHGSFIFHDKNRFLKNTGKGNSKKITNKKEMNNWFLLCKNQVVVIAKNQKKTTSSLVNNFDSLFCWELSVTSIINDSKKSDNFINEKIK